MFSSGHIFYLGFTKGDFYWPKRLHHDIQSSSSHPLPFFHWKECWLSIKKKLVLNNKKCHHAEIPNPPIFIALLPLDYLSNCSDHAHGYGHLQGWLIKILSFWPNSIVKPLVAAASVPVICKLNPVCEKEELERPFWFKGRWG